MPAGCACLGECCGIVVCRTCYAVRYCSWTGRGRCANAVLSFCRPPWPPCYAVCNCSQPVRRLFVDAAPVLFCQFAVLRGRRAMPCATVRGLFADCLQTARGRSTSNCKASIFPFPDAYNDNSFNLSELQLASSRTYFGTKTSIIFHNYVGT